MKRRHAASDSRDRGSVAVEFALLLPVLLLILFGIIDFGRAISYQITLTQAAREGARVASLGGSTSAVTTRAQSAAYPITPVPTVTVMSSCPAGAGAGADAKVVVSYTYTFLTPVGAFAAMFGGNLGSTLSLSATGETPCET